MYKIVKEKGSNSLITLKNTNASMVIGRISIRILNILNEAGYETNINDRWNIEIDEETSKKLMAQTIVQKRGGEE